MIVGGSYSHVLSGWRVSPPCSLEAAFLHSVSTAQLRSCRASQHLLAVGSEDSSISLFNLHTGKQTGVIHQQQGAITSLAWNHTRHLVSASRDGTICVWRARDFQLLKQLKAHRAGVLHVSLHPSAKLLLSVGSSSLKLKLWNMLTGVCDYVLPLARSLEPLNALSPQASTGRASPPFTPTQFRHYPREAHWSSSGHSYAVLWPHQVDLYSTASQEDAPSASLHCLDGVEALCWGPSELLLFTAHSSGHLLRWDLRDSCWAPSLVAHLPSRIKCLTLLGADRLVSATSQGLINVYSTENGELLGHVDADDRITCITTTPSVEPVRERPKPVKRKQEEAPEPVVVSSFLTKQKTKKKKGKKSKSKRAKK